jgi:hypothetical protein
MTLLTGGEACNNASEEPMLAKFDESDSIVSSWDTIFV